MKKKKNIFIRIFLKNLEKMIECETGFLSHFIVLYKNLIIIFNL